jgi:hypothetical protein
VAVRTVTVNLRMNAVQFLTNGRAVVRLNGDMADSFRRLATDATAANNATESMSRQIRQLGNRARIAENRVRELREEINRLAAAAAAANANINIINGPGGGGGRGGMGGLFGMVSRAWHALPHQVQLAIIGAAVAMAVMFVTALGGMIGALMTLLLGGVVIAAMVAIAAKTSDAVQSAFARAFGPIGTQLQGFAQAAMAPLVLSARDFGDAWTEIGPQVKAMFELMAQSIRPLAQGLIGFVGAAMPGLNEALQNAGPIIRQFAHDLPAVGRSFGEMFARMSRGQGVIKGMRAFMMLLSTTFTALGNTVGWLADRFDWLTRNGERMTRFLSHIPLIGLVAGPIADSLAAINDAGVEAMARTGDVAEGADDLAVSAARAAQASGNLAKQMAALNDQLEATAQKMLALDNARLAFNQGLLDLKKQFQDNGRSLNDHTEKGIANRQMLNQLIEAAMRARAAFIEQNRATLGVTEATRQANAIFGQDVTAIQAVMRAAGFTAAQINAMTAQWMAWVNTPANVSKSSTITTYYRTDGKPPPAGGRTPGFAPGVHNFNRQGGLHHARGGLVGLNGQAQMFRAGRTMYGFAEAGTGGEAFIARNADHGRSLAIANQAAAWHGGRVVTGGGGGGVMEVRLVPSGVAGGGPIEAALFKYADDALHNGRWRLQVVGNRVKPV